MTKAIYCVSAVICILLVTAGLAVPAYGFFPKGGFNLTQQLRYATWPFREFDTNENGTIEQGEGLEFRIESGPRGFTNAEIDQVLKGFGVWQNVPTSYVAFRFVGNIEDPILPGSVEYDYLPMVFLQVEGIGDVEEGETGAGGYTQADTDEYLVPGLDEYMPAITFLSYAIDTTVVDGIGRQVIIPAGTILDCDIVVNAATHRAELVESNTFGTLDLQATVAHQVGQLLGLAYTPLNNLDPFNEIVVDDAENGLPVEPAVLQLTGADGIRTDLGATPTMFPTYFLTEMPSGNYLAGWRDLAPDDISGITWLYPRQDGLENFFSIQQESRTQVRETTGVPSEPISGAHIVAWASRSGNDGDTRIPLFSTMSGLYQLQSNAQLKGRFNLMGLWKQMEVYGGTGELFEPSYVITMNSINGLGYDRQAPPEMTGSNFDSIVGGGSSYYHYEETEERQGSGGYSYTSTEYTVGSAAGSVQEFISINYSSEVFNEFGNVYGIDNNTTGTPLVWSFEKNTVISKNSGNTLPAILPTNTPMFGDADVVCPMNVIENVGNTSDVGTAQVQNGAEGLLSMIGIKSDDGGNSGGFGGGAGGSTQVFIRINNHLRAFRDTVLLKSAMGTALVDMYYRMAPYLAYQLLRHETVLRVVRGVIVYGTRIWETGRMIIALALCAGVVLAGLRRLHTSTARLVLAGVFLFLAGMSIAFAGQLPFTIQDHVAGADLIFTGKVVSTEGRMGNDNRIYTDVVVKVDEVVKGELNRGSTFSFSVIGGIYGNIVTTVSGLPIFAKGDEALMYFRDTPRFGVVPFGGYRSKVPVHIDPETGVEVVEGESAAAAGTANSTTGESATMKNTDGDNMVAAAVPTEPVPPEESAAGFIRLDDYLKYLRALVRNQQ